MSETKYPDVEELYKKIKQLSNRKKLKILELTQEERKNIKALSKEVKLAYNKCSNYVSALEKEKLVVKEKEGKEVYVKSVIDLSKIYYPKIKPKK